MNSDKLTESLVNKLQEANKNFEISSSPETTYDWETRTIWIDSSELSIGTGENILNLIEEIETESLGDDEIVITDEERDYLKAHPKTLFVLNGRVQDGFELHLLWEESTTIDKIM